MTVPASLASKPLRKGSKGPAVKAWQELLAAKGFVVKADGVFGAKTRNATLVAQGWAGVKANGVVTPAVWKAVARKKRTRRPGKVVRHVLGFRPKIVDARHGRAGFPVHKSRRWAHRPAAAIKAKLGHYTGGPASFRADADFHVHSDYLTKGGAPAIAYHLGVDPDGTLFVFNDYDSETWHCDGGHNHDTLGVVFRGGADGPTAAQKRTLRWLWRELEAGVFQPTKGERPWPKIRVSTTHRHVNSTSCPGEVGERFYRSISPLFLDRL